MREEKKRKNKLKLRAMLGGFVGVPIRRNSVFGSYFDLDACIPKDADCIMVMVNSGRGLNAGWPKPVGFVKLTHQLYVRDLEKLLKEQSANDATGWSNGTRWITVAPMRSKDFVDVWSKEKPN